MSITLRVLGARRLMENPCQFETISATRAKKNNETEIPKRILIHPTNVRNRKGGMYVQFLTTLSHTSSKLASNLETNVAACIKMEICLSWRRTLN